MFQHPIFQQTYFDNKVEEYCLFAIILLTGIIFKKFISKIISRIIFNRFIKKYSTGVGSEKFLELLKKPFGIFVLLITFYVAANRLMFPINWNLVNESEFGLKMTINRTFQASILLSFTWIILRVVDYFALILSHKSTEINSTINIQLVAFLKETVKVLIIIFNLFLILGTVFNVNISSLIAGLGIGGLAFALAAKESIENLIGSFTLFIDKPFVVGDLVKTGNITGHIERIGFRSTRIRTADKTFLTIPNKKLVDAELDNYTQRTMRKVNHSFGLAYETPLEKIKLICNEIESYIKARNDVVSEETRVRFYEFGSVALEIMLQYFIKQKDWETYVDSKEEINFKILEIVEKHNCNFSISESVVTNRDKKN